MATGFTQNVGGPPCRTPKAALSELQWGKSKVFPQIVWSEEERREEKGLVLVMGNVEQGRAVSVPGESKWVLS